MKACVVGAVAAADSDAFYSSLLSSVELVVAADGGAALCRRLGVKPHLVVGDLDSLDPLEVAALEAAPIPIERHPRAKDRTDLDLAVEAARRLGADHLVVTAAFSARLDHTLAALGCLLDAADLLAEAREPGWSAWALDATTRPDLTLRGAEGTLVSILSPEGADGVTLKGFAFPPRDSRLDPLSGLGVSNVLTSDEGIITLREGRLLVLAFHPTAESPSAG
ncbi:MAG: thiamine diphosphokinase [Coriobacteriaceae bacterium]|nr:thiamine diphosphokinase [Coriobacteriaceae bacterium]